MADLPLLLEISDFRLPAWALMDNDILSLGDCTSAIYNSFG